MVGAAVFAGMVAPGMLSAAGAQAASSALATTMLPVTDAISFSALRREMRPSL
jgi:hypothetical protein